jgi:hypothetical protein
VSRFLYLALSHSDVQDCPETALLGRCICEPSQLLAGVAQMGHFDWPNLQPIGPAAVTETDGAFQQDNKQWEGLATVFYFPGHHGWRLYQHKPMELDLLV